MEPGWVKIYQSADVVLLEMMKQSLETEGIYAIVLNKVDSTYNSFGQAELYVQEANREAAEQIING